MFLRHHSVPFAARNIPIVSPAKHGITLESSLATIGPKVCVGVVTCIKPMIHGLCIVHVIEGSHRLQRKQHQLLIGISLLGTQSDELTQGFHLQLFVLTDDRFPLTRGQIISVFIEHFGRDAPVIFVQQVQNAGRFRGLTVAELLCTKAQSVVGNGRNGKFIWVPCHVHE